MRFILNIGLEVSKQAPATLQERGVTATDAIREVLKAYESEGVTPQGFTVFTPEGGETTLICEFEEPDYDPWVQATTAMCHYLCGVLGQDCIAIYAPYSKIGKLIGPRAAAWGDFNPEYFYLPNSEPLRNRVAEIAGGWAEVQV